MRHYGKWLVTIALVWASITVLMATPSGADDVYTFIVKKQEQKKNRGWNLADWLETRDRMRLMDLWLAIHSPSPYEFYLGGDANLGSSDARGNTTSGRAYLAGYASIFGLELQRGFSPDNEWDGIFHLRIFGLHAQGTNITLQGGIRSETEPFDTRNAFAGAGMTVYLGRFFGLDGLYRHHFQGLNTRVSGNHYQGGVFIDFKYLRLYGNYYSRPEVVQAADGSNSNFRQHGYILGSRIYF